MRVQAHGSSEEWPMRKQEPIIDTENITCLSTIVPFKHLSRVSVLGEISLRSSHRLVPFALYLLITRHRSICTHASTTLIAIAIKGDLIDSFNNTTTSEPIMRAGTQRQLPSPGLTPSSVSVKLALQKNRSNVADYSTFSPITSSAWSSSNSEKEATECQTTSLIPCPVSYTRTLLFSPGASMLIWNMDPTSYHRDVVFHCLGRALKLDQDV